MFESAFAETSGFESVASSAARGQSSTKPAAKRVINLGKRKGDITNMVSAQQITLSPLVAACRYIIVTFYYGVTLAEDGSKPRGADTGKDPAGKARLAVRTGQKDVKCARSCPGEAPAARSSRSQRRKTGDPLFQVSK